VVEPVAWMVYTEDGKSVFITDNPTDINFERDGQRALPLYTETPFQELTESEMGQFIHDHCEHTTYRSLMDFATDLNNCLKRKNT
jgi:hypothetical protein